MDTNVLVEGSTYAKFLEISNGPVVYGGDVNAPTVKMRNCMVCGSIYGKVSFDELKKNFE